MSMNKTCPISNFTSDERSDGIDFLLSQNPRFNESIPVRDIDTRPQPCKRCAASAPRRSSSDSWLLFCGQFLKTTIVPDLIPDRIESQQRRSNRKGILYLQQPLENGNGVVGIPQQSVDLCRALLFDGALEWILGSGMHGHSFLSFGDSGGRFAQTSIGPTQNGMQLRLFKRIPRYFVELALKILRRFLVRGARRGDIAGALLTQTWKKSFVVPWIKQFAVGGHH